LADLLESLGKKEEAKSIYEELIKVEAEKALVYVQYMKAITRLEVWSFC
jgi:hypothetical protein